VKHLWILLLSASLMVVAGCGGGSSTNGALAGNWQFTMANPADNSFTGGLQGGFLQQSQGSVTGGVGYWVAVPTASNPTPSAATPCNSGSAPITGTISGQNVTLTATAGGAGGQTFTLTGTLTGDGTTMMGTYTSTAGTAADGSACGTAQSGLQLSAMLVPALSGNVQGNFHSIFSNQNHPVTGTLQQAQNTGTSSATITGTLAFQGYSCLGGASAQTVNVNGTISGDSVVLQIFSNAGVVIGQIGQPSPLSTQTAPVAFLSALEGYVVRDSPSANPNVGGYSISTKACSEEGGHVCLDLGNGTNCTQPIQ